MPDLKFSEDPYDKAVINLIYIQGKTGSGDPFYGLVAQSRSGRRFFISSKDSVVTVYEGPWKETEHDWGMFNHFYDYFDATGGSVWLGLGRIPGKTNNW